MPFEAGQHLLHYRLIEKIGQGGMGEVYRAADAKLGRDVAVKVLPPDMAADLDRLARFEREARVIASLNHPSIVTIHSVEQAGDVRFLTMELVEPFDFSPPAGRTWRFVASRSSACSR